MRNVDLGIERRGVLDRKRDTSFLRLLSAGCDSPAENIGCLFPCHRAPPTAEHVDRTGAEGLGHLDQSAECLARLMPGVLACIQMTSGAEAGHERMRKALDTAAGSCESLLRGGQPFLKQQIARQADVMRAK